MWKWGNKKFINLANVNQHPYLMMLGPPLTLPTVALSSRIKSQSICRRAYLLKAEPRILVSDLRRGGRWGRKTKLRGLVCDFQILDFYCRNRPHGLKLSLLLPIIPLRTTDLLLHDFAKLGSCVGRVGVAVGVHNFAHDHHVRGSTNGVGDHMDGPE